ncbi:predicted protein, partial [Nematostella vectensis]
YVHNEEGIERPKFSEADYLRGDALKEGEDAYGKNQFNQAISDKIGGDRDVPDTRHSHCRYEAYPSTLPATSIIITFHNEARSTLLRTVKSLLSIPNLERICRLLMQCRTFSVHQLSAGAASTSTESEDGQGTNQYDRLSDDEKGQVQEVLFLLDKYCVGDNFYHELSMISNGLPKSYLIKQCRDNYNDLCHIKDLPNNHLGSKCPFAELLTIHAADNNPDFDYANETLKVKINGDGARMTRNSNFIFLTFSILQTGANLMSAKGNRNIAAVNASESYTTLKEAFSVTFEEINNFIASVKLTVNDKTINLKFFLGGDYKFVLLMLGLKGATANYACAWCKIHKDDRWKTDNDFHSFNKSPMSRSLKEIKELYVLTKNLVYQAIDRDKKDDFDKKRGEGKGIHLKKLVSTIRSLSISFDVWEQLNAYKSSSGEVIHANCTCVAGKVGFCNHSLALMLKICKFSYIYECKNVCDFDCKDDMNPLKICTSRLQKCHKRSRGDVIKPQPVMDLTVLKISNYIFKRSSLLSIPNLERISRLLTQCRTFSVKFKLKSLSYAAKSSARKVHQLSAGAASTSTESEDGQGTNQYDRLSDDEKGQVQEVLFLLDKYCVGDNFYHELSMISNGLPKSYLIKQCRDNYNDLCHIKDLPNNHLGSKCSFAELLTIHAADFLDNNPDFDYANETLKLIKYSKPGKDI